jgi:hypothetical protein
MKFIDKFIKHNIGQTKNEDDLTGYIELSTDNDKTKIDFPRIISIESLAELSMNDERRLVI